MTRKPLLIAALALPLAGLAGCTADRPTGFAAALPPPPVYDTPEQADGAIFQVAGGYSPLFYGQRASRVGDLVTVVLVERTQTSKSASSDTKRDGGISLTPPSTGALNLFDPSDVAASGSSTFKGQGSADQTSALNGSISVTIAALRPNGTAVIRGEKVLQLSQGEEWIQLSGIIRLSDIDRDNRIASQRIADARITYSGKGAVQQASREGWLVRFFNMVTPF